MTLLRPETPATTASTPAFGPASALACRECGTQTAIGAHYVCLECYGPLEVVYSTPGVTRESIAAGPLSLWRYKDFLPVPADVAQQPGLQPGWTKLVKADNLARELGV